MRWLTVGLLVGLLAGAGPVYDVVIHPTLDVEAQTRAVVAAAEVYSVVEADGITYACHVPREGEAKDAENEEEMEMENWEPDLGNMVESAASAVRKGLGISKGTCFPFIMGKFAFDVCPFDTIVQKHRHEKDKHIQYKLGVYSPTDSRRVTTETGIYQQVFLDGDEGRISKLLFKCHSDLDSSTGIEDNTIISVKEPVPKMYEVTIATSSICDFKGTQIPQGLSASNPLSSLWVGLEPLVGKCHYFNAGWWIYKLCHLSDITQFHQKRESVVQEDGSTKLTIEVETAYTIGHFINAETSARHGYLFPSWADVRLHKDRDPSKSYLAVTYSNGEVCEPTGEPRTAQVHLLCDNAGPHRIRSVYEPSACNYVIEFATNTVCSHPAFIERHVDPLQVECFPQTEATPQYTTETQIGFVLQ